MQHQNNVTRKFKYMETVNKQIAMAIAECIDDREGRFNVEVELDDKTFVEASGWYEVDGYCEDDYFNGTGSWVTSKVCVSVEACEVFTYSENGEQVAGTIVPDINAIESYAEDMAA